MKKVKLVMIGVSLLVIGAIAGAQLGDLLKIAGVGAAVDRFGPDINKAVNKLQGFSDSEELMTKVVPIVSVGKGTAIGAAQVMGPPSLVKKVNAVGQLETDILGRVVRIKALIPIESKGATNIKRVVGVGVSAVIDLKV